MFGFSPCKIAVLSHKESGTKEPLTVLMCLRDTKLYGVLATQKVTRTVLAHVQNVLELRVKEYADSLTSRNENALEPKKLLQRYAWEIAMVRTLALDR